MYDLLKGMTVIEGASFIAGPSCALHLQQMGADVIRFDAIGGGPDRHRWPRAAEGASLYWEGLNKGKRSIAIDLRQPAGRELAVALITAMGEGRGYFVTNFPAKGFLAHEKLTRLRPDLITLRVMGWPDGRNGVDYTVNAAVGVPFLTGPADWPSREPIDSVLPAWDLYTGAYAAFALLAADRRRRMTGQGAEIRLALSDVAASVLGNIGQIAETQVSGDRGRNGNALFGAFGRDFLTRDNHRLMIVAITERQWSGLLEALEIQQDVDALERELGISFAGDEGLRYVHRDRLFPIVGKSVADSLLEELAPRLEAEGVCWEQYRSLDQAVRDDPRLVRDNELFEMVRHPSGIAYPTPGAAARLTGEPRKAIMSTPRLGEHTDEILAEQLGLDGSQIARLHDLGVIDGPSAN